jgi:hypothetical protein
LPSYSALSAAFVPEKATLNPPNVIDKILMPVAPLLITSRPDAVPSWNIE